MVINSPVPELQSALRELKPYALRVSGFGIVASLLVLAPSWYMLEVYDRVVNSRNVMTLAMLTLAVLLIYAVMEALEWARSEIAFAAASQFETRLASRVFGAAFEASRKRQPGGGMQAVNDLHTVRQFVHSPVLAAVVDIPAAAVFLVLIWAISPVLGMVALAAALLQVLMAALNISGTRAPLREANQHGFAAQQFADRMARSAPVIAAMGMAANVRRRWLDTQSKAVGLQARASGTGGVYQSLSKLLQNLVNSALLGVSAWLLLHDSLNGGPAMLIVAGILGGRVLAPFVQIILQWQTVAGAQQAWGRLQQLMQAMPAVEPAMPLPAPQGMLTVDSIVACAPGQQSPILKGLGFAVEPGEVCVVMGPSASGKSSLARVVLGVWPTASGHVRLDGVAVATWNKQELGPHLGYVPQGVELIEGTLADNIARFGDTDRAPVEAAARLVGLHEFIESLPQGYDTPIGPGGCVLSGGQRQRVALARALYGSPTLVVLDEPNASLDEAGDAALTAAIMACKQRGATVIVMSHRPSVLNVADKLLLLRDGQQQAFGPRDEVLAAIQQARAAALQQAQVVEPPRRAPMAANG